MKIKGDSYYAQRRADSLRGAAASLAMIIAVFAFCNVFFMVYEDKALISVVEEVTEEYIIVNSGIYYYETPRLHIPKTDNTPFVFKMMPVINYTAKDGIYKIFTLPFYLGCMFLMLSVYFTVRFFKTISQRKAEAKIRENILQYGSRLDGEYVAIEKLKGIRNFRIKVAEINPITKEERYFYSTTLNFDPKLFIPEIKKITIHFDPNDPEAYIVDFHGAIPHNEHLYYN